ncbi:SUMF1/EgtB/PvdO family nonheme iron enzyme [Nitrobacter sp. TKz-YC02]|uniref:SUMF1/EgtB/PvdO family nonheme iron enzyme n=1 Tax=Nitrobacter sp. TKz-YC02 TaxID=3398704 RepID=UPI003CE8169E
MMLISGGTFPHWIRQALSERGGGAPVTIGAFWMDRTAVTNRHFREFVRATGHKVTVGGGCRLSAS